MFGACALTIAYLLNFSSPIAFNCIKISSINIFLYTVYVRLNYYTVLTLVMENKLLEEKHQRKLLQDCAQQVVTQCIVMCLYCHVTVSE